MPEENTTIEYKQLLDNGEPFYPMVGKSSYSEWIGYEEIEGSGARPDDQWIGFVDVGGATDVPPHVVPVENGGTGQSTTSDALNALLGHGTKNFTIIAYVNSSYEVNFTYNELGIPTGGTMIMASLNQTHWSGDDVYHSVWQGFSWNDTDRLLKIRFWSTRSSQASVPIRLDYIYTK